LIGQLSKLIVARENPSSLVHAARTAVATIVSYLVARLFHLPEDYWAPLSTLIVMQLTLRAALPISVQSFAGTAIGAAVGAATATYFRGSIWAFGISIFLIGILCAVLRVERSAYRYASVTLAIVVLVPRSTIAWEIAIHRFVEVSLGIVVGLMLSAFWPERQGGQAGHQNGKRIEKIQRWLN
jgi:uncharacterized membrane protein YgaE (UPF0421/DUF939 family)